MARFGELSFFNAPFSVHLDGRAIRNANLGDSHESIRADRFAEKEKTYFHNVLSDSSESHRPAIRIFCPETSVREPWNDSRESLIVQSMVFSLSLVFFYPRKFKSLMLRVFSEVLSVFLRLFWGRQGQQNPDVLGGFLGSFT